MQQFLSLKKPYLAFLITVSILFCLCVLTQSALISFNTSTLSSALIIDFVLTVPIVYFVLIRKSTLSKTTVVPIFILGIVLASYCIPKEHQSLLNVIKTWVFPLVELSVISFLLFKVRRLIIEFKKNNDKSQDFFSILKTTTTELLPRIPAIMLAMEITVFYYGFVKWKAPKLTSNSFTYHKTSGTPTLLCAIILLIAVETVTIHFLAMKWNATLAYILLGLSIYSGIQIFGILKSLFFRPTVITKNHLNINYGILAETSIPINNIENIEFHTKDIDKAKNPKTVKLSPLGDLENHNLLITLKEEQILHSLYGSKKSFKTLALHIDKKERFKNHIESLIIPINDN